MLGTTPTTSARERNGPFIAGRPNLIAFTAMASMVIAATFTAVGCSRDQDDENSDDWRAPQAHTGASQGSSASSSALASASAEVSTRTYAAVSDCDPVNQTDCPDGERCMWSVADDSTTCYFLPPLDTEPGDPCSADEVSCEAGQVCTALGSEEGTRCYAICDATTDFTCPTSPSVSEAYVCMPLSGLTYGLCVLTGSQCDVLNPSACEADETCSIFGGVTSCVPAGDLGPGEDCTTASCGSGLMCIKLSDRPTPVCLNPCDANTRQCPNTDDVCVGLEGFSFGACQSIIPECSPLTVPDACDSARTCGMRGRFVRCMEPGSEPIGADCTNDNCAPGGLCVRFLGESNAACREPCDLQDALCSNPSEACQDIGLDFGVCR